MFLKLLVIIKCNLFQPVFQPFSDFFIHFPLYLKYQLLTKYFQTLISENLNLPPQKELPFMWVMLHTKMKGSRKLPLLLLIIEMYQFKKTFLTNYVNNKCYFCIQYTFCNKKNWKSSHLFLVFMQLHGIEIWNILAQKQIFWENFVIRKNKGFQV